MNCLSVCLKNLAVPLRLLRASAPCLLLLGVCALLGAACPELALASDDFGMGGVFETITKVITGKWGKMISIAGMAMCGIVFIFARQDMAEGFKLMMQVVFGICFIVFAVSIVDALFSFTGALI